MYLLDAGVIMKFLSKDNYHKEIERFFSNDESLDIAG
jgi:predicted nucleic acid-binding protein